MLVYLHFIKCACCLFKDFVFFYLGKDLNLFKSLHVFTVQTYMNVFQLSDSLLAKYTAILFASFLKLKSRKRVKLPKPIDFISSSTITFCNDTRTLAHLGQVMDGSAQAQASLRAPPATAATLAMSQANHGTK